MAKLRALESPQERYERLSRTIFHSLQRTSRRRAALPAHFVYANTSSPETIAERRRSRALMLEAEELFVRLSAGWDRAYLDAGLYTDELRRAA